MLFRIRPPIRRPARTFEAQDVLGSGWAAFHRMAMGRRVPMGSPSPNRGAVTPTLDSDELTVLRELCAATTTVLAVSMTGLAAGLGWVEHDVRAAIRQLLDHAPALIDADAADSRCELVWWPTDHGRRVCAASA